MPCCETAICAPWTGKSLADEVIHGGISDARNPILMKMFNLIGIGEKAGNGFDVMRAGCDFAGTAYPELEVGEHPDRVTLTLYPRKIQDHGAVEDGGISTPSGSVVSDFAVSGYSIPAGPMAIASAGTAAPITATGANATYAPNGRRMAEVEDDAGGGQRSSIRFNLGGASLVTQPMEPQFNVEKITRALTAGGPLPTSQLAKVLGLGLTRTREILGSMVGEGVIEPVGVGRGRKYQIVSDKAA